MDLESAGTSNGIPSNKKLKYTLEKDISKRDWTILPETVLKRIFSYLDVQSINNCAQLCSTFFRLSKDSSLYKTLHVNYGMSANALEYHISKVTRPSNVIIHYASDQSNSDDYTTYNQYVLRILENYGEYILSLELNNCREEDVITELKHCVNLKSLILFNCKGTFNALVSFSKLTAIDFSYCHFSQKVVSTTVKNNPSLYSLYLRNNVNINLNELIEIITEQLYNIKELHINENKQLRSKSLKLLSRLKNLKKLSLISNEGFICNPEDSLEFLAAGCPHLESLCIDNWSEINDTNLISALRLCSQLMTLELRRTNITIKSCKEAALSLPLLKSLIVDKCQKVKKSQLISLREDFEDLDIPIL
ncbi:unnamed protein product [Phyllotreta striolata]|uniref:F-box domain-containing protein n=1 Tax=Phyllotreta striolata TaxID=444603 RepID=A0A9N9XVS6_PHYSR|nr:unnamed protein product [Phyllotreta striolata]